MSLLTGGLPAFFMLRARRAYRRAASLARAMDAARREELAAPIGTVAAGLCRASTTAPDGFPPMVPGHALQRAWIRSASGAASATGALANRGDSARRFPVLLAMHDGLVLALEGGAAQWGGLLRAVLVRWLPLLSSGALRILVVGAAEFLPAEFLMLRGVEIGAVEMGAVEIGGVRIDGVGTVPTIVLVAPGNGNTVEGTAAAGNVARPVPLPGTAVAPGTKSGFPVAWVYCGGTPNQVRAQVTLSASGLLLLDE